MFTRRPRTLTFTLCHPSSVLTPVGVYVSR